MELPYKHLKKQMQAENVIKLDSSIADITRRLDSPANLIMVDQNISLDELEFNALLRWVKNGGTVFFASEQLPRLMQDSLGVMGSTRFVGAFDPQDSMKSLKKSVPLFFQPSVKPDTFKVYIDWSYVVFVSKHDSSRYNHLAKAVSVDKIDEPVMLKYSIGKGQLFLHCLPLALTNYQYLQEKPRRYLQHCFSVLPKQTTYWDAYHKPKNQKGENRSLLRVIGEYPSLNTAWYLLLFTVLVYLFLSGRRRQRIIPKREPKQNQSVNYATTLGDLYYKHADPQSMLMKRIQALQTVMHQQYHFQNIRFSEDEIPTVARKLGMENDRIKEIWKVVRIIRKSPRMTTEQFVRYNRLFSKLYKEIK
jgi:hypothetical protein